MKLYDLKTVPKEDEAEISVQIDSVKLGQDRLWFSTPKKFESYLCKTRMDGFLVGLLFPAMQYGENIHVSGCVSEKLLFNLNNYVIPLLLAFSPSCKRTNITADETSSERFYCKGVGTGFSAGVDSFCTIYDRFELENSPDYKINSFLFLNVGSHGSAKSEEKQASAHSLFRKRYDYLKQFSSELGLDFIPLNSNLHYFHPWEGRTQTLATIAGILILQGLYHRYYYGSAGLSYSEQLIFGDKFREISESACCDPMLVPLLSTESLDFVLDGMQYSRTEKILHIMDYSPVKKYLNVCVEREDTYENCSVCTKCSRTLMTLTSAGVVDQFAHLFDIKKYKKMAERNHTCEQVLKKNKNVLARQNIELATQNKVKLPSWPASYIFVLCWRIFIKFPQHVKKKVEKKIKKKIKKYVLKKRASI
jgi:hypothetical protein